MENWRKVEKSRHCSSQSSIGLSLADMRVTRTGAEACALDGVGTVEPGKTADLLIVEGDPLEDISILQDAGRIQAV